MLVHAFQGRLIGDQPIRAGLPRPAEKLEGEALDRDRLAAESAPRVAHVRIEAGHPDRLVDRIDRYAEVRPAARKQPLPVADVRGEQDDRTALCHEARDQLRVVDDQALLELLGTCAPAPEQLDEHFAHVAIRLLQDDSALGGRFFRE